MIEDERDEYQERYLEHQAKKRVQLAPFAGESEWRHYTPEEAAAF